MFTIRRKLTLDIFDYSGNKKCTLYDNHSDVDGQATDVVVMKERNGWKELSFEIPSVLADGSNNYRCDFLIADYRIRLVDDEETDWYLISESKVTHKAFSKNISVTAGHISQLLKTKNLSLEFNDKELNNTGTAYELLNTILDGTGWEPGVVSEFLEDDGSSIKRRSLKASAKTGAFKLITQMCELFEAKPIFHGEGRTVDIIPINPFSKPEDGQLPVIEDPSIVHELHYGVNVKNVTRSLNTDNLVTKFYAYGSYGDTTAKYCGIDECEFTQYQFTITSGLTAGTTYWFTVKDDADIDIVRHFTPTKNYSASTLITYSFLDPASLMYVWCGDKAYFVESGQVGTQLPSGEPSKTKEKSWFSSVMDFTYYKSIGLFDDTHLQKLALYQIEGRELKEEIYDATVDFNESSGYLADTIGDVDFCKLAIKDTTMDGGYVKVTLDDSFPTGVRFRTDYFQNEKYYFKWTVAEDVQPNGDPVNKNASIIYIVKKTGTAPKWYKVYIKSFPKKKDNGDDDYMEFVTYATDSSLFNEDNYDIYLFSVYNVNGQLGSLETQSEAAKETLEEKTTIATVKHPVYYYEGNISFAPFNRDEMNRYAWLIKYDSTNDSVSQLYFAYSGDATVTGVDTSWQLVKYGRDENPPTGSARGNAIYYYSFQNRLYKWYNNDWVEIKDPEIEIATIGDVKYDIPSKARDLFSTVIHKMEDLDRYYKGRYEYYDITNDDFPVGSYYIEDKYGNLYTFTTTTDGIDKVRIDFNDSHADEIKDGVENSIVFKTKKYDSVFYHPYNIFSGKTFDADATQYFEEGGCDPDTGGDTDDSSYRSAYLSVVKGTDYICSTSLNGATVYCYTSKKMYIASPITISGSTFTTPINCSYIRVVVSAHQISNPRIYANDYDTTIVIDEINYKKIKNENVTASGDLLGINVLMRKFVQYANDTYLEKYPALKAVQDQFNELEKDMNVSLGDMYREGYWQDNNYSDGDEYRLYKDALKKFKEVSKPNAKYTVDYLDLYGINAKDWHYVTDNEDYEYYAAKDSSKILWPEIKISSAIHLVDPEIGINQWAYVDKIQKAYDKPWNTKISINTNMSTMAQHSFTDVLANIANVVTDTRMKESYLDRALYITGTGKMTAERLEGTLAANKLVIDGGESSWYTDERGNMIFEAADGSSAMKITGSGFGLANSKDEWGNWNWRSFGNGDGFSASELITGYLSATLIEAGSITTDLLASSVGDELNIASNRALNLFATVDGKKPAGGVKTPTVAEGDSYIQIAAKKGTDPAHINIMSGGIINIATSAGNYIKMGGNDGILIHGTKVKIESGSTFDITANGAITLSNTNSTIKMSNNGISLTGGNIALNGLSGISLNGGYINLDTSSTNYIHLNSNGVIILGANVVISGSGILQISSNEYTGAVQISSRAGGYINIGENSSNRTSISAGRITVSHHGAIGDRDAFVLEEGQIRLGMTGSILTDAGQIQLGNNVSLGPGDDFINTISGCTFQKCYLGADTFTYFSDQDIPMSSEQSSTTPRWHWLKTNQIQDAMQTYPIGAHTLQETSIGGVYLRQLTTIESNKTHVDLHSGADCVLHIHANDIHAHVGHFDYITCEHLVCNGYMYARKNNDDLKAKVRIATQEYVANAIS